MNITRRWKRFLAVGCSHGIYADKNAIAAVLRFQKQWKPDVTVHLGDAIDCSAFMSSNVGRGDGDPIEPDVAGGLDFLEKLRPQIFLAGNHEARLWRLAHSRNEVVAYAALHLLEAIKLACARLKCELVEYTGNDQCRMLGETIRLMHGTLYNEQFARDTAEAFAPTRGKVIFAHAHKVTMATGRRHDQPTAYCVGTLTKRGALEYANTRRATLAWSAGFAFGEYTDTSSVVWLHEQPNHQSEWRLPTG